MGTVSILSLVNMKAIHLLFLLLFPIFNCQQQLKIPSSLAKPGIFPCGKSNAKICAPNINTAIKNCFNNPSTGLKKGDFQPVKGSTSEKLYCIGRNTGSKCLDCVCVYVCQHGSRLSTINDCKICRSEKGSKVLASFKQPDCPTSTSVYDNKCEQECGYKANADQCLRCLQKDIPSKCITGNCNTPGEQCKNYCKICIYRTFLALKPCRHQREAAKILKCMSPKLPSHLCEVCLCWTMCKLGMKNVCEFCHP